MMKVILTDLWAVLFGNGSGDIPVLIGVTLAVFFYFWRDIGKTPILLRVKKEEILSIVLVYSISALFYLSLYGRFQVKTNGIVLSVLSLIPLLMLFSPSFRKAHSEVLLGICLGIATGLSSLGIPGFILSLIVSMLFLGPSSESLKRAYLVVPAYSIPLIILHCPTMAEKSLQSYLMFLIAFFTTLVIVALSLRLRGKKGIIFVSLLGFLMGILGVVV